MKIQIPRCFDSHMHLLATGAFLQMNLLNDLADIQELKNYRFNDANRKGNWLFSFGWDHHKFQNKKLPNRHELDKIFPDQPVFFTRADGHSGLVNTKGLLALGLFKKRSEFDSANEIVSGKGKTDFL